MFNCLTKYKFLFNFFHFLGATTLGSRTQKTSEEFFKVKRLGDNNNQLLINLTSHKKIVNWIDLNRSLKHLKWTTIHLVPTAPKTMISSKDYLNVEHPCYFLLSWPMLVYQLPFYFSIPSFGLNTLDLIWKEQSSTGWSLTFAGFWKQKLFWDPMDERYHCGNQVKGPHLTLGDPPFYS